MIKLHIPLSGHRMADPVKVGALNNGGNNFDTMRKRIRGIPSQEPGCIETIPVKETDGFKLFDNDGIKDEYTNR